MEASDGESISPNNDVSGELRAQTAVAGVRRYGARERNSSGTAARCRPAALPTTGSWLFPGTDSAARPG